MGILNSRQHTFYIAFPKDWLYPEVEEKFKVFRDRHQLPYRTILDYLNSTIQSVSFPEINGISTQQVFRGVDTTWRGALQSNRQYDTKFTINFHLKEGFINYWIFREQWDIYQTLNNKDQVQTNNIKPFLPPIRLSVLDQYGYILFTLELYDIVFTSMSSLELSYASNVPEVRTFSCDFSFSRLEFKYESDNVVTKH